MNIKKEAGILFHPVSLPGPYGIGEFGSQAFSFAEYLQSIGASLWQILPLSPTGYGNSPYSARSTFAGNELLISIEQLLKQELLRVHEIKPLQKTDNASVDYDQAEEWKLPILMRAARRFLENPPDAFHAFCRDQSDWLDDYALFMTLTVHGGDDPRWHTTWDKKIAFREEQELDRWKESCREDIAQWKALQYFFYTQWQEVKTFANSLGISIVGDMPIFVSADSVDTWTNRQLFKTDKKGAFSAQSGVPPDLFSSTGQLWGMPVYDWKNRKDELFSWWKRRISFALQQVDILRIDHFRGFRAYWEVPAGAETAESGRWVTVPGEELFRELREQLGELPIIAEDLGVITPDVEELRDDQGFPGMKILQFAFNADEKGSLEADNPYLPHNYIPNCVAYTGTHDNQTTAGWYAALPEHMRDLVRKYFARPDHDMGWTMVRGVMSSCANRVIVPLQDILGLGDEARMNAPATVGGHNWSWRVSAQQLEDPIPVHRFREMAELYGRASTDLSERGSQADPGSTDA